MTTKTIQITELLKSNIQLAKEMIESVINRFENGKIKKEIYYSEIQKWDNKLYSYQKDLQKIENE